MKMKKKGGNGKAGVVSSSLDSQVKNSGKLLVSEKAVNTFASLIEMMATEALRERATRQRRDHTETTTSHANGRGHSDDACLCKAERVTMEGQE